MNYMYSVILKNLCAEHSATLPPFLSTFSFVVAVEFITNLLLKECGGGDLPLGRVTDHPYHVCDVIGSGVFLCTSMCIT